MSTPCISTADTLYARISATDDAYCALLRQVRANKICGRAAGGAGKSGEPILNRGTLTLKIVAMRRAILKMKEGLAHLSLDLIYDLKEYSN
jgi:hypothetical protein